MRKLIDQQSSVSGSLRGNSEIRSLLRCPAEDSADYPFPHPLMTSETQKRLRQMADIAYSVPSDRTRPRWKKKGRRWTRSVPFDMPAPMFDLGVVLLCLLAGLATLFV